MAQSGNQLGHAFSSILKSAQTYSNFLYLVPLHGSRQPAPAPEHISSRSAWQPAPQSHPFTVAPGDLFYIAQSSLQQLLLLFILQTLAQRPPGKLGR